MLVILGQTVVVVCLSEVIIEAIMGQTVVTKESLWVKEKS